MTRTTNQASRPQPSTEITLLVASAGLLAGLLTAAAASARPNQQKASAADAIAPLPFTAQPTSHWAKARDYVSRQQPNRAVFHLRRHLDAQPDDVDARSMLARAYADLGLKKSALKELHLVLAVSPTDPGALLALARMQARNGQAADALATVERLQEAGDHGPELAGLKGRLLFRLGRHAEATRPLTTALSHDPSNLLLLQAQGLNALKLGSREDLLVALDSFTLASNADPANASLQNNLGFARERLGNLEGAYLAYVEAEGLSEGDVRYAENRRRLEVALSRR